MFRRYSLTTMLGWMAFACAIVLVFSQIGGRSSWVDRKTGAGIRDAAGWDWVAMLAGLVVVGALLVAWWAGAGDRRGTWAWVVAAAAFVVAAQAAGRYWADTADGFVQPQAATVDGTKWTTHVAESPPRVTVAAIAGAAVATVMAIRSRASSD